MAAPVNDRDVLLQASGTRFTVPTNAGLFISPPAAVFKVASNGTATPSSFTFKAKLLNLTGPVTFSWTGGMTLSAISGSQATLDYANFTAVSGTVTASITVDGVVYTEVATVTKVSDGASGTGTPGPRGNVDITAITSGSVWSDSEAAAALSAAGYGAPQIRDIVTLANTNPAAKFTESRIYSGTVWQTLSDRYNGALLIAGTVYADAIDTKGLIIRDALGNGIVGAGVPLNPAYAAPGTRNSEASFSPAKVWEFRSSAEGWTPVNTISLATGTDTITVTSSGGDPILNSPTISLNGGLYDKIRMRVRRKGGASWQGQVYYRTAGHDYSELYTKILATDPTIGGAWTVIEWDMANLTNGGTDWTSNTITSLRVDLGNASGDVFEIDWIAIGKYSPAAIADFSYPVTLSSSGAIQVGSATYANGVAGGTGVVVSPSGIACVKNGALGIVLTGSGDMSLPGMLRTATSGARVELSNNLIEGFAVNNVRRYKISA